MASKSSSDELEKLRAELSALSGRLHAAAASSAGESASDAARLALSTSPSSSSPLRQRLERQRAEEQLLYCRQRQRELELQRELAERHERNERIERASERVGVQLAGASAQRELSPQRVAAPPSPPLELVTLMDRLVVRLEQSVTREDFASLEHATELGASEQRRQLTALREAITALRGEQAATEQRLASLEAWTRRTLQTEEIDARLEECTARCDARCDDLAARIGSLRGELSAALWEQPPAAGATLRRGQLDELGTRLRRATSRAEELEEQTARNEAQLAAVRGELEAVSMKAAAAPSMDDFEQRAKRSQAELSAALEAGLLEAQRKITASTEALRDEFLQHVVGDQLNFLRDRCERLEAEDALRTQRLLRLEEDVGSFRRGMADAAADRAAATASAAEAANDLARLEDIAGRAVLASKADLDDCRAEGDRLGRAVRDHAVAARADTAVLRNDVAALAQRLDDALASGGRQGALVGATADAPVGDCSEAALKDIQRQLQKHDDLLLQMRAQCDLFGKAGDREPKSDLTALSEQCGRIQRESSEHARALVDLERRFQRLSQDASEPSVAALPPSWASSLREEVLAAARRVQTLSDALRVDVSVLTQRFERHVAEQQEAATMAPSPSAAKSGALRSPGRLPFSTAEETRTEEVVAHLALGVLKMAQLLGVTPDDGCDGASATSLLSWREAAVELAQMVEHAWVRSRIPKRSSVLKQLRQKAEAEHVRELQAQLDALSASTGEERWVRWSAPSTITAVSTPPALPGDSRRPAVTPPLGRRPLLTPSRCESPRVQRQVQVNGDEAAKARGESGSTAENSALDTWGFVRGDLTHGLGGSPSTAAETGAA